MIGLFIFKFPPELSFFLQQTEREECSGNNDNGGADLEAIGLRNQKSENYGKDAEYGRSNEERAKCVRKLPRGGSGDDDERTGEERAQKAKARKYGECKEKQEPKVQITHVDSRSRSELGRKEADDKFVS